jgi:hypothetical protein
VTFTRAGLIAFAVGLVLYLALLRPPGLGRLIYIGIVITLAMGVFVLPRVTQTSWYQKGVVRAGDLAARETYWTAAWPVIVNSPQHFLLGHGINSLFRDPTSPNQLLDPQPDIEAVPSLVMFSPHSQYVRTLVEEGLGGADPLCRVARHVPAEDVEGGVDGRPRPFAGGAGRVCGRYRGLPGRLLRQRYAEGDACFALVALVAGTGVTLAQARRQTDGGGSRK